MKRGWLLLLFLFTTTILFSQDTTRAKKKSKVFIPKYERSKGYVGWIEGGINIMRSNIMLPNKLFPYPSFRIFNGARLSRRITFGIEGGLDYAALIAVNAKVRVNILKRKITPFFDFAAGYSYTFLDYYPGHGFNFTPSFGFKAGGKQAAFTFRVGYNGIVSKQYFSNWDFDQPVINPRGPRINYFSGINIMTGVEF